MRRVSPGAGVKLIIVNLSAGRYLCNMELSHALDLFGALLILIGGVGFMMLMCLGIITIVPDGEEKEEDKEEKK